MDEGQPRGHNQIGIDKKRKTVFGRISFLELDMSVMFVCVKRSYLAGFRKVSRERLAESLGAVNENVKLGKRLGTQY